MTAIVFDFSDIKRRAMFPANRPQDAGTPVIPAVQQFDEWGMYVGCVPSAAEMVVAGSTFAYDVDTAPET